MIDIKNKLFVLSIDAMVREDVEYMLTKPNFRKIMDKRAEVEKICTVYPALTLPAHTSILTGCRPGKTGIYTNGPLKAYKDSYYHWHMKSADVRVENFFAAAKRAGCTTASVYWPVTATDPNIDYLIAENFLYFPKNESAVESFVRYGSNEDTVKIIEENLYRIPEELITGNIKIKGPKARFRFDDFLMGCTCSLIREYQPDVLFAHTIYLDTLRHGYGLFSKETKDAMDRIDEWLGDIVAAMHDAGVYDNTNFVILSDHGQMDFKRYVKTNALLVNGGFVDIAPDGSVYNWHAFCKTNGFSTGVYMADPNDKTKKKQIYDYLVQLKEEGKWGISEVLTAEEVSEKWGTYGTFSFVLESDGDTSFSDEWSGQIITTIEEEPGYIAKHGYQPEKGPQPIFMGKGPDFAEGVKISNAYAIDIAPTLAAILKQEMPQAEGKCLKALLA